MNRRQQVKNTRLQVELKHPRALQRKSNKFVIPVSAFCVFAFLVAPCGASRDSLSHAAMSVRPVVQLSVRGRPLVQ